MGPAAAMAALAAAVAAYTFYVFGQSSRSEQERQLESSEAGPGDCNAVLLVSSCVAFNEGFAATAIFAFCAKMTEDLRESSSMIGYFSGLLYTANYTGILVMAYPWARFSDRVGRRRCLLLSTFSCMTCNLLTAFTDDYWMMVALRMMCGLLNANNPISRTSLRETFSRSDRDDTHAFSFVSTSYAVSSLLGPSLGGLLYGTMFRTSWTLPWLLITGLNLCCFLVILGVQPETIFSTGEAEPSSETHMLKDRRFILVLSMAWGHSYVFTGWETVYPTFAELSAKSLGEDWSTVHVGLTFLAGGIALVVYNTFLYAWMVSKFTVIRLWIWSWILPLIPLAVFPRLLMYMMAQHVDSDSALVALLNYGSQVVLSVLLGSGFTSIQLILNEYVASLPDGRSQLASANGGLASVQAFARAVSPTITGGLFSASFQIAALSRAIAFDHLAVVGVCTGILLATLYERS
jgi:MFS family permease